MPSSQPEAPSAAVPGTKKFARYSEADFAPVKARVEAFFAGKLSQSRFSRDAVLSAVTMFVLEADAGVAASASRIDKCPTCGSTDKKVMLVAYSFRYSRWRVIDEKSCRPQYVKQDAWHEVEALLDKRTT